MNIIIQAPFRNDWNGRPTLIILPETCRRFTHLGNLLVRIHPVYATGDHYGRIYSYTFPDDVNFEMHVYDNVDINCFPSMSVDTAEQDIFLNNMNRIFTINSTESNTIIELESVNAVASDWKHYPWTSNAYHMEEVLDEKQWTDIANRLKTSRNSSDIVGVIRIDGKRLVILANGATLDDAGLDSTVNDNDDANEHEITYDMFCSNRNILLHELQPLLRESIQLSSLRSLYPGSVIRFPHANALNLNIYYSNEQTEYILICEDNNVDTAGNTCNNLCQLHH